MASKAYTGLLGRGSIPQSEPLDARQVRNDAGGHVFVLDDFARLDRFLVLGSEAQTYYQSARDLTRANAACVEACWARDPGRTAGRISDVSASGRAPRQAPALFALALGAAHPDAAARRAALAAVPATCRTASHLFEFVSNVRALGRGWGRGLKRTVAAWYAARSADDLAYQAVKYRQRSDYTHARLLRASHPSSDAGDAPRRALYGWACGAREYDAGALPAQARAHLAAMAAEDARTLVPLVLEHRLPWEALPTWALSDPDVWRALIPSMGPTALVRNLGTLTRLGVLKPLGAETGAVCERLRDPAGLRAARVHPFHMLQAHAVYGSGRAVRGSTSWTPVGEVTDALDAGFYAAYGAVEKAGGRHLYALDVSGSMATSALMDSPLTAREASAALALVAMATEDRVHVTGFSDRMVPLDISPRGRLRDAVATVSGLTFGRTDCAQPMLYALREGLEVDTFHVVTDNETWAGHVHPVEALRRYRRETGIPAKLVVVGMTATSFTIADPRDGGMMDVVGFDAGAPSAVAEFARVARPARAA